jgi:putative ABC transport system permease protein
VTPRDIAAQATLALSSRSKRTIITAIAVAVGVSAAIATVGLSESARIQVSDRFDRLIASELQLRDTQSDIATGIPADVDLRLANHPGVLAAGVIWSVPEEVNTTPIPDGPANSMQTALFAATPGAITAIEASVEGRTLQPFHDSNRLRVALVGRGLASRLDTAFADGRRALYIDGLSFAVIGVIDDVTREAQVLDAVVIPNQTALALFGDVARERLVLVRVTQGAAETVAEQAPLSLTPSDPNRYEAFVPPNPPSLRHDIESALAQLSLAVAVLLLVAGAIGIANASYLSVVERRSEIGLRQALGATRRQIAAQILLESVVIGTIGGILGISLGVFVTAIVSIQKGWTPVLDPMLLLGATFLGPIIGTLAGVYPARQASRLEPVVALRDL